MFRERALKALKETSSVFAEINFSAIEKHRERIFKTIQQIQELAITKENGSLHGVHFFTDLVFELPEIPNLVFKINSSKDNTHNPARLVNRVKDRSRF